MAVKLSTVAIVLIAVFGAAIAAIVTTVCVLYIPSKSKRSISTPALSVPAARMAATQQSQSQPQPWAVLITTAAKPPIKVKEPLHERTAAYKAALSKWMDAAKTPQHPPVFVVESTGHALPASIPPHRLDSFVVTPDQMTGSPSKAEAASILHALDTFHDAMQAAGSEFVLKVTGRYFIPDVHMLLRNIPANVDIVLQHNRRTHGQNTEVFGFRRSLAPLLFGHDFTHTSMEFQIQRAVKAHKLHVYRLPPIPNVLGARRCGDRARLSTL